MCFALIFFKFQINVWLVFNGVCKLRDVDGKDVNILETVAIVCFIAGTASSKPIKILFLVIICLVENNNHR